MNKFNIIITLLVFSFLSGCGLFTVEVKIPTDKPAVKAQANSLEDNIASSLKNATKDDCITIYKVFMGASEYFKYSTKLKNTLSCFDLIGKVEDDYGWSKEKYKDLTDCIESDLKQRGFALPKDVDANVRADLVNTFKQYADAVGKVIDSKK